MVIHIKEKTKLHVKTAPETKIKAGNVLTVERTPKFAGAEREAKADNMNKRMVKYVRGVQQVSAT